MCRLTACCSYHQFMIWSIHVLSLLPGSPCGVVMSHLQNWLSIVMTPVWPMSPLSSYFWPGSDSGRNNSPANHLQYQSSRSPRILAISWHNVSHYSGHVASSHSEAICVSEDREISSPDVSIGVTWHVSSGYIALPASPECWQILTTGCCEARLREPRILSRPQWIQKFKDLTQ